jgi:hypothetical protein
MNNYPFLVSFNERRSTKKRRCKSGKSHCFPVKKTTETARRVDRELVHYALTQWHARLTQQRRDRAPAHRPPDSQALGSSEALTSTFPASSRLPPSLLPPSALFCGARAGARPLPPSTDRDTGPHRSLSCAALRGGCAADQLMCLWGCDRRRRASPRRAN